MDNKPTHNLYNVIDHGNDIDNEKRGIWTRIGAAWPNGDGKGFSPDYSRCAVKGSVSVD